MKGLKSTFLVSLVSMQSSNALAWICIKLLFSKEKTCSDAADDG